MRSNNPTRFLLKRNLFIGVIVFLTVFYAMPFWGLSHISQEKESILAYHETAEQARSLTNLVSSQVMSSSMNLEMMVVVFGGLGFLTAMMLFRHLFSRRQGMLHASLPDKRETDYLRRCIGYVVLCLMPIVLNFLLYLAIVAANGLLGYVAWAKLLPKFGLLLLINLYGFAMGMLSSVLTGTYWAALLAGAVLIVGMEGLATLWRFYLADLYLHTMVETSFREAMLALSPSYSLYKGFYQPQTFSWLPGLLAIVAALGAGFALYRIRRTEVTERTLAFGWLHTLMGFVLPVMGGSILGVIFLMSFATELSLIVGMVLGAVLTFWVCRMVFEQRFCGILHQWYLPAAGALLLVAGVAVLHTDALGYDSFLPKRDALTAISYRPQSYDTDEYITLTSKEALDAAYEWCTMMRDEVDAYPNGMGVKGNSSSAVTVTYQCGGKKVYRQYSNLTVRTAAQPLFKTVIESDDYKQSLIQECGLNSGNVSHLYLNTRTTALRNGELYEKFGVFPDYTSLSGEKDKPTIDRWLAAICKDIETRTFAEKQQDAIMSLQLNIEENGRYLYRVVDIHPSDELFLREVFGDKAKEIVEYAVGGYASSEDILTLMVTYSMSRKELEGVSQPRQEYVKSIRMPSTPEEAAEWVKSAQNPYADRYYYMPDYEDSSFSTLYLYRLSDVERYKSIYHYEVPEDKTQIFMNQQIPIETTLELIGK